MSQAFFTQTSSIRILPPLIAERIAAGEVIERPASVVKELVENSIDAGATRIEVRLQKGGCDLIEVTDNGSGMSKEDLEVCVCRHATSKIQNFEDLSNLGTLGFRGEALPSIASVSELTILSRKDSTYQIKAVHTAPVKAKAESQPNFNFLGDAHGTQIKVTSLFSQIPARLKFLKSPGAESSAVREIIERLALTHPEVSFSLISDERNLLNLPAESLKARAERMLTDGNPIEILECQLDGAWSVHVIWLKGLSLPHTRSMYQVVNGRALRDRILQQAILSPLRQSFLPGNFPAIVVNLNIPKDEIDVNVHPTKTEIRFLDSKKIFALCHAAIEKLLVDSTPTEFWSSAPMTPSFYQNFSQPNFISDTTTPQLQTFETSFEASPFGQFRGVLFQTYLTFEMGEELLLVDQHAAHERIRYESLKNKVLNREQIESQELLIPELIKVQREDLPTLSRKLPVLKSLGFDCEVFGEDTAIFRTIPSVWGNFQLTERLKNLLERLNLTEETDKELVWDETLFEKVAMEACRSSVKAGDRMTEFGAIDLAQKLSKCMHPGNCPHGRPTFIKISKLKVEEWFSRKILKTIILSGPTASGKSALAIEAAKKNPRLEIINADSVCFYQEFNIGSAKPSSQELEQTPHHLINVASPTENYHAARFLKDIEQTLREIHARGNRAIIVGGSGFYLKALRLGMWDAPETSPEFRKTLETQTNEELYGQLVAQDAAHTQKIGPKDRYRIIRALEIIVLSGKTPTELEKQMNKAPDPRFALWIIDRSKEELNARILKRIDQMLVDGLIEETQKLRQKYPESKTLHAVGYQQVLNFLDQIPPEGRKIKPGLEGLKEEIALAHRQLAKQQRTWFKSLNPDEQFLLSQDLPLVQEKLITFYK